MIKTSTWGWQNLDAPWEYGSLGWGKVLLVNLLHALCTTCVSHVIKENNILDPKCICWCLENERLPKLWCTLIMEKANNRIWKLVWTFYYSNWAADHEVKKLDWVGWTKKNQALQIFKVSNWIWYSDVDISKISWESQSMDSPISKHFFLTSSH